MRWVFVLLICVSLSKQLVNLSDHQQVFPEISLENAHYTVMLQEERTILELDGKGAAIHLQLIHHHVLDGTVNAGSHSPCYPKQHNVKFIETLDTYTKVLHGSEERTIDPLTGKSSDIALLTMVHIKGGVAILASDMSLYVYAFEKINQHHRATLKQIGQLQHSKDTNITATTDTQLAYNGKTQTLYVVFRDEIISAHVDVDDHDNVIRDQQTLYNHDFRTVEAVLSSYHFVYVATNQEVFIFAAEQGKLTLMQTINDNFLYPNEKRTIEITDIAVGGQQGQYLYVIDRHFGISIINVSYKNKKFASELLSDMGVIPVINGFKLDQYLDESILVLTDNPGVLRDQMAVELTIDIPKGEWFVLNQARLKGRSSDVDISRRIAVVRGIDSHEVLFHSIWDGFAPLREVNTFYAPRLKSVDFFEEKYGVGSPDDWHYNQSHEFLFGITNRQLVLFPWQELNAGVECNTKNLTDVDTTFLYTLMANTTDCETKRQHKGSIIPDLTMCHLQIGFTVKVAGVFIGSPTYKILFVLGVLAILALLIAMLVIFRRLCLRYNIKRKALEQEIQGFVSKGYRLDDRGTQLTSEEQGNI